MLNIMRKYATSWLIKILLGAIVIVFVLWGVGSFRSQKQSRVAVVDGETISIEEYRAAYNNILERLRQQFGNNLNDEMLKIFQVKQQALNQIIDKRLLMREAERLNMQVSDAELALAIRDFGAFQTNGHFDRKRYQNVLALNRLTPEGFETLQRETMTIEKLRGFIEANVRVSAAEALEWYTWQNTAVDIEYVVFEPTAYSDIDLSPDDIKSFYEKRKESYKTAPMAKVRYLLFKPSSYRGQVSVTEQQLKEYYESNPEAFKTPKTVEARHILFKVDQDADAAAVEAAKAEAVKVLAKARAGEDFAELAKTYSQGPSKDSGGYLGKFKKEDMVKPFADRAFAMKAGEISDPVRTQFGWHLIKVEAVNEEKTLTFAEAKEQIREKLIDEQAKALAYDAAEAAYNASYEGDDLGETAVALDLAIHTTDLFTRQGPADPTIKDPARFAEVAFKLSQKEISEILDFDDGYYILQLVEKVPEKVSPLEEVRGRVAADLKKEKQEEKAKAAAEAFLAALQKDKSLKKAADQNKRVVHDTGYFKRNESIPEVGYDPNMMAEAFRLSDTHKISENVIKGQKGYYVISFKGRKLPDPQAFEKEKAKIKEALLQQKKRNAFSEWIAKLRQRSDIKIAEEYAG